MDRQKMLWIFGGAWVSAALLTWFLWAETKAPKNEQTVNCVAATHDMPAGTRLKKADIKVVRMIEKSLPKMAVLDENSALERVLLFPVSANETLTTPRLASANGAEGLAATIERGKRAISVQITDTSGVAGLIQPRSHVDVLFTRPGSMAEAMTSTILEDVTVLSIGRLTESQQNNAVDTRSSSTTRAATLIVTPEEAAKLELAKNEGKISLALRNPLDRSTQLNAKPTTASALNVDPSLLRKPAADVRDPNVWTKLKGPEPKPEPPKPHLVVDVFRGEKHVQEIFQ
jgi:pilus assembly protein CpaB